MCTLNRYVNMATQSRTLLLGRKGEARMARKAPIKEIWTFYLFCTISLHSNFNTYLTYSPSSSVISSLPHSSDREKEVVMAAHYTVFIMGVASLLVTMVAAEGGRVKFAYSGPNGPKNWGNLDPNYKLCSSGKEQSPINIQKKYSIYNPSLKSLDRNYEPTNATLINNGFNIQLLFEKEAGAVFINGKNYTLRQLHWHTPSEHTVHGQHYATELHLVHKSEDGNIAVVGILYKYGHADPFINHLKDKLDQLASAEYSENGGMGVAAGEIDTKSLRRHTRSYYQYIGSLTTPPCSENVLWTILSKVRSVSREQVATLRAPLNSDCKKNSRPSQALNGRTVWLYHDHPKANSHFL